jgi:hypothetical protein
MSTPDDTTGLTKDAGWQFGLRRTFSYPRAALWDLLFSERGLSVWLGRLTSPLALRQAYATEEGIEGMLRVFTPYSHIRMSWKPSHWENASRLQIRVMGDEKKVKLSFHQEKLADAGQREEMKAWWNAKMQALESLLAGEQG